MKGLLLDTHAWMWYVLGSSEIKKSALKEIKNAVKNNHIFVSAISLWEISMLEKKQRIIFEMPCLEWIKEAINFTHAQILHLTPEIAVESCNLPGRVHEDPADRIIIATARIKSLSIVTRDSKIVEYSQQKYASVMKI